MSEAAAAWAVVQLAELVPAGEELLLRTLRVLPPEARSSMPDGSAWTLSSADAAELRTLLVEHNEVAERLRALAERLPDQGLGATFADIHEAAAEAMAHGILDPALVKMAAATLTLETGWRALADALSSTDVRTAWADLQVGELLGTFRGADRHLVRSALADAEVPTSAPWARLTADAARRLAAILRAYARRP